MGHEGNEIKEINQVSTPANLFSVYKEYNHGGRIDIMNGYVKKSDHKHLMNIAREFALLGNVVEITTNPHFKSREYGEVFGALFGTVYERKCPDLRINGIFYEFENYAPPFDKNKISHMISKGVKQASRIIINNNKGASDRFIRDNIYRRFKDKTFTYNIDEVWLYEKGKLRLLYKKR